MVKQPCSYQPCIYQPCIDTHSQQIYTVLFGKLFDICGRPDLRLLCAKHAPAHFVLYRAIFQISVGSGSQTRLRKPNMQMLQVESAALSMQVKNPEHEPPLALT